MNGSNSSEPAAHYHRGPLQLWHRARQFRTAEARRLSGTGLAGTQTQLKTFVILFNAVALETVVGDKNNMAHTSFARMRCLYSFFSQQSCAGAARALEVRYIFSEASAVTWSVSRWWCDVPEVILHHAGVPFKMSNRAKVQQARGANHYLQLHLDELVWRNHVKGSQIHLLDAFWLAVEVVHRVE